MSDVNYEIHPALIVRGCVLIKNLATIRLSAPKTARKKVYAHVHMMLQHADAMLVTSKSILLSQSVRSLLLTMAQQQVFFR